MSLEEDIIKELRGLRADLKKQDNRLNANLDEMYHNLGKGSTSLNRKFNQSSFYDDSDDRSRFDQLNKLYEQDPASWDETVSRYAGLKKYAEEALKLNEEMLEVEKQKFLLEEQRKENIKDEINEIEEINKKLKEENLTQEEQIELHKKAKEIELKAQEKTSEFNIQHKEEIDKCSESEARLEKLARQLNVDIKNCQTEQDNFNKRIKASAELFSQLNQFGRMLLNAVTSVGGKWLELNDSVHKSARALGQNVQQMKALTSELSQNASVIGRFYNLDATELVKQIEQIADATGRVRLPLQNEQEMMAYLHNYGADGLAGAFDQIGGSVGVATARFTQMQKNADALGLNLKIAQKSLQDNIGMMNKLTFRGGVSGLERMILLSQQLKLNVKEIESIADKVNNVEGAVQVGAQMNALGGSFGANFSNPLELMYMANYNAEGLMEKLTKIIEGRALFNEKTGIVEISAIDKQLLKTASQSFGINYEDLLNSVSRRGVIKAVESRLTDNTLNETQKAIIANRATYDASKGKYMVKMMDGSELDVSRITSQNVGQIVSDKSEDAQLDIRDNVRAIAQTLLPEMRDRARGEMSVKEKVEADKKAFEGKLMAMADVVMSRWGENTFNNIMDRYGPMIMGSIALLGAVPSITSTLGGAGRSARSFMSNVRTSIGMNDTLSEQYEIAEDGSLRNREMVRGRPQDHYQGENRRRSRNKPPKAKGKRGGGKLGKALGLVGLIAGGTYLATQTSNASNTSDIEAYDNLNFQNNNSINNSTLNNIINDDKQVVKELQTQTMLLTKIAQSNGAHIGIGEGGSAELENSSSPYRNGISDYINTLTEIGYLANGARISNSLAMMGIANGSGRLSNMGARALGIMPNGVQSLLMKDAVKVMGNGVGSFGAILGFGLGATNTYTGINDMRSSKNYLENYKGRRVDGYATDSDFYDAKAQHANGILDTSSGIGTMAGTIIGGVLGSVIPGAGTMAGATAGGFIGDLLGTGIGYLMGGSRKDGREIQNDTVNQFASEVEGFVSIDDPDLIPKAMLSVIKIHELLAYKWNKDEMKVTSHQTQQTFHAMQVASTNGEGTRLGGFTNVGGSQYVGGTTSVRTNGGTQTLKLDISGNLKINGSSIEIIDFNKLAHNHEFVNAIISAINQKTQQNVTADSPIGKHY